MPSGVQLGYFMNINIAEDFLEFLDPTAEGFTFQYYPDMKNADVKAGIVHGPLNSVENVLASRNRTYSAVGVCVNQMDGKGRSNENVTKIRAVWHDDDAGYALRGGKFPLEPSLTVQTSTLRYHHYWVLDPYQDGLSLTEFEKVQSILIDEYQSDQAARARCQALRLVGSKNWKSFPQSFIVKIVGGSGIRYSGKEIIEAFGVEGIDVDDLPIIKGSGSNTDAFDKEVGRLTSALEYLPSDQYADWFKYGAAIYDASNGSQLGFDVWDQWAKGTGEGNYSAHDNLRLWSKTFAKGADRTSRVSISTIFHDAIVNGWNDEARLSEAGLEATSQGEVFVDFKTSKIDNDLFPLEVMKNTRTKFESYGHKPTEKHYEGLFDESKVFQRMAAGLLGEAFYLSALPCGMGKTSVVIECTKTLLAWPDYKDAGVIYFLSRLEEINNLVNAMGLSRDEFSVIVSEGRMKDVTDVGNPDSQTARVLFTTQQQLETRTKGGTLFGEISAFFYKGRPRKVRVWDEAIVPSRAITLERFGISRLFDALKKAGYSGLANDLEDWAYSLKSKESGDIVEVPDVNSALHSLEDFRDMFIEADDRDRAEALWCLSGRTVRIRKDNLDGATTLDYDDSLPSDLAPMLILDASGGLRKTYTFWERHRGGLCRLDAPEKTYGNLTVHHWNRGAGKSAYQKLEKAKEIADGVAAAINTKVPLTDEVLVIHRLKGRKSDPDMIDLITKQLNPKARVHFCNWGKHTATNQYAHVKHVILAGILQYNDAQYEAVGRGAKRSSTDEDFSEDDYQRIRFGEIAHNIFQAACRGTVRKSVDGDCPEGCNLYMIFSTDRKRGFPRDGLEVIFPQATIKEWKPLGSPLGRDGLSGKALEAFDYVSRELMAGIEVKSSSIMGAIGMKDRQNFTKRVLNDQGLLDALKSEGIVLQLGRGRIGATFTRQRRLLPWEIPSDKTVKLEF